MRRETVLAGALGVVVVAMLLFVAFVPGAIAEPEDPDRVSDGRLSIREVQIAPGQVSGGSATLQVDTRITHRGGDVGDATLEVRAIDAESGLVRATRRVDVADLTEDGETRVVTDLSVSRSGGYRIETILYQDGRRVETGRTSVQGLGSLKPAYAETPVRFHEFETAGATRFPIMEYSVADVDGEQVTLDVSTYLTNEGDGSAGDLRLVLKARQSDSNVLADRTELRVGSLAPGATLTPTGQVTVPDGYNYYLEAYLWKGDTLIATARSAANLAPNSTLEVEDGSDGGDGLQVSDFESDQEPTGDAAERRAETTTTGSAGPGFGVGVAVLGLAALAAIGRRYHD